RLTLKPGMGLGGRVLQTGTPILTKDYLCDDSLTHDDLNDQAVAAERLRSMLGVPVGAGENILGVLFVANRDAHVVTEKELTLLQSLAAHAAVAVRNAQQYEELRKTAEELEEARRTANKHA